MPHQRVFRAPDSPAPVETVPPLLAIGSYYAQYLSGYYLNKTREEAKRVDPHLDDYLRKQLIGIVDTLKLLDPNNLATARLEVGICAPACGCDRASRTLSDRPDWRGLFGGRFSWRVGLPHELEAHADLPVAPRPPRAPGVWPTVQGHGRDRCSHAVWASVPVGNGRDPYRGPLWLMTDDVVSVLDSK